MSVGRLAALRLLLFCVPVACQAPASTEARAADCEGWREGRLTAFFESAQADDVASCRPCTAARPNPAAFPALLRLGADLAARDDDGGTPLDCARENRALQGLQVVRRTLH